MNPRNAAFAVFCLVLASTAVPARAQFVRIDDFQSYTTGVPIDGLGWWTSEVRSLPGSDVVVDPLDASNHVLSIGQAGAHPSFFRPHRETINTSPALSIANGTTATLYYRMYWEDGAHDLSIGMTAQFNPISDYDFNSYGAYESQLSLSGPLGGQDLRARDGGDAPVLAASLAPGVWYDVWSVIDNAADTTQFYIQGGAFASQTLLSSGPQTEFLFRHGVDNVDLRTFQLTTGYLLGPVLLDDLHIDTAGANLSTPVGAPADIQPITTTATLTIDPEESLLAAQLVVGGQLLGDPVSGPLSGTIDIQTRHLPGESLADTAQFRVVDGDVVLAPGVIMDMALGEGTLLVTVTEAFHLGLRGLLPRDTAMDGEFPLDRLETYAVSGNILVELLDGEGVAMFSIDLGPEQMGGGASIAKGLDGELGITLNGDHFELRMDAPLNATLPAPGFPIELQVLLTGRLLASATVPVPEPHAGLLLALGAVGAGGAVWRRRRRAR